MKLKLLIFTISTLLISACGPTIPRSELQELPILIEIVALNTQQKNLKIRVTHRNKTPRENNQLSCQLAIKNQTPIQFSEIIIPDLTHYARETVDIRLSDDIPDLQTQQLDYVLDCWLSSTNFRQEQAIKKATLFKVPGTTGEYR